MLVLCFDIKFRSERIRYFLVGAKVYSRNIFILQLMNTITCNKDVLFNHFSSIKGLHVVDILEYTQKKLIILNIFLYNIL